MHPKQRFGCWLVACCAGAAVALPPLAAGLAYRSLDGAIVTFIASLFIVGLAAPLVVIVLFLLSARSKPLRGECLHCGYNLTGNRVGICPECGRPIDTPP